MGSHFSKFIFVASGAFFYWTLSGYNGKFDDYMSRHSDNDAKYFKNFFTGMTLIGTILVIIGSIIQINR